MAVAIVVQHLTLEPQELVVVLDVEMVVAVVVRLVALQTMENTEGLVVFQAVEEEVGVYKPLDKLQIMLVVQEAMEK